MLTKAMGGVFPQFILEGLNLSPRSHTYQVRRQQHVAAWLSRGGGPLGHLKNLSAALVEGQATYVFGSIRKTNGTLPPDQACVA